jgi:hypothetical protein
VLHAYSNSTKNIGRRSMIWKAPMDLPAGAAFPMFCEPAMSKKAGRFQNKYNKLMSFISNSVCKQTGDNRLTTLFTVVKPYIYTFLIYKQKNASTSPDFPTPSQLPVDMSHWRKISRPSMVPLSPYCLTSFWAWATASQRHVGSLL